MMEEQWKKMVDYENEYEISSRGKICSIEREVLIVKNFGQTKIKKLVESKMISVSKTSQGSKATLFKDGNKKLISVARMMLLTFNPPSKKNAVVMFEDGDIHNVTLENCRWGTKSEVNENIRLSRGREFYSYPYIHLLTRRYKDGTISQKYYRTFCKHPFTGKILFVGNYKDEVQAVNAQDSFLAKLEKYTPRKYSVRYVDDSVELTDGCKWVPGFENLYEVHPVDGVFRCAGYSLNKEGKKLDYNRTNVFKYDRYCNLVKMDGSVVRKSRKSIMAELFVDNPKGYTRILHKNKDVNDCSIENLEWVDDETYWYNVGKPNKGTKTAGIVYDSNTRYYKVMHNRKYVKSFWTQEEAIEFKNKLKNGEI